MVNSGHWLPLMISREIRLPLGQLGFLPSGGPVQQAIEPGRFLEVLEGCSQADHRPARCCSRCMNRSTVFDLIRSSSISGFRRFAAAWNLIRAENGITT